MNGKTYLITGGAGFIGCTFSERLLERGEKVLIFDNLSRKGTRQNKEYLLEKYPDVTFIEGNISTDFDRLKEAVNGVDVVFHLAGQVAVTTSIVDPRSDFESNALGTFNVLEAARQADKPPVVVYASTNKVYGGMEEVKIEEGDQRFAYKDFPNGIPETQLLDFHSPYGCSKGAADQYVRDYARIYDLPTVVMRQSCIYGTRQFGVEDQGWVAWFSIAATLDRPITVYGNGKQVRDVLFVDDLFKAWDAAVQNIGVSKGKIYNVGGGPNFSLSLLELLELLRQELGKEITFSFDDWRPGDQPVYISDISKIEKDLGWKPATDVAAGVKQLVNWTKDNTQMIEQVLGL